MNNITIADFALCRLASLVREQVDILAKSGIYSTTFEIGTAIAFLYFLEEQVDIAVIEVGLGGLYDPTNVIMPEVCVIAAIGFDHMGVLGNTLSQIAAQKAGITKPGVPVAVYPLEEEAMPSVIEAAKRSGSELLCTREVPLRVLREDAHGAVFEGMFPYFGKMHLETGLVGHHQIDNARLAVCALSLLCARGWDLPAKSIVRGIAATKWAGRLEWTDERTLIDGAHNPQGAQSLCDYVCKYLQGKRRVLVTGMMHDKQINACAKILAPAFREVVATRVDYPRAASTAELRAIYEGEGCACCEEQDIAGAIDRARNLAGADGIVVIAGSLYVAGEARLFLTGGEKL